MKFIDVVDAYLDKPYRLGLTPVGMDCLGLVWSILKDLDKPVFHEMDGHDIFKADYADLHRDMEAGNAMMRKVFSALGEEVSTKAKLTGDVLLMKDQHTGRLYLAIYTGNGNAISSFIGAGVTAFSINSDHLVAARRVPDGNRS